MRPDTQSRHVTLDIECALDDCSKLTLSTLQCAACNSTQAQSSAAGHTALCASRYISAAMCKVLQTEVADFNAVLHYGITFCHVLMAAGCGHYISQLQAATCRRPIDVAARATDRPRAGRSSGGK